MCVCARACVCVCVCVCVLVVCHSFDSVTSEEAQSASRLLGGRSLQRLLLSLGRASEHGVGDDGVNLDPGTLDLWRELVAESRVEGGEQRLADDGVVLRGDAVGNVASAHALEHRNELTDGVKLADSKVQRVHELHRLGCLVHVGKEGLDFRRLFEKSLVEELTRSRAQGTDGSP